MARDFATREDLEIAVARLVDKTLVTIEGTKEELKRLSLSRATRIHGVPCVEVDKKGKEVVVSKVFHEKPPRGDTIAPFGLNDNLNTP